jgi:tripartite ATP-independent transporter DctM subunit
MSWTLLLLILVLAAALMEMPLFTVIAGISAVCLYAVDRDWLSLQVIFIEMNRLASMPVLVALPLFTFTGCLLTRTAAPQRVMSLTRALFGWLPGGLAIAALGSCAFFTALTGASGVTIVAMGSILYPVLRKRAYRDSFTLGLLTTSGSLGLLFPPSLAVILYGVVAQVPITELFTAALMPGVMLVLLLSLYCSTHRFVTARPDVPDTAGERVVSWSEVKTRFRQACWDWPIMVILVLGVYGGFVTIAEVSAVILVYVVVVECFLLREVKFFRDLPEIVVESAVLSGAIIIILGFALGFTGYLVDEQIPGRILKQLATLTANKYVFLAGLNIFLLAVGCIMDIFSAIVIVVPIIVPIALQYGVDPIHLGVIFLVNLEIGYSTPPVGINLFIASLTFRQPVTRLYRASFPYLVILLLALVVITYLPELSLWLLHR